LLSSYFLARIEDGLTQPRRQLIEILGSTGNELNIHSAVAFGSGVYVNSVAAMAPGEDRASNATTRNRRLNRARPIVRRSQRE
jgi:hypothetical protein